jgi:protein-tyrosine phosphatase
LIDLHCHVLPGLDDGALDLEDSVAMGRQADADGIELICATPHIRHDHDVRIGELAGLVESLGGEYARRGLGVRLTVGGEVAETVAQTLTTEELDHVSLGGGGRWILLEPAPGELSGSLLETADHLAGLGFRSLIAHPELVDANCLVQVTAAHLATPERNAVTELAERGLVHVLGSDAHSARVGRPVELSDAIERLRGIDAVAPHVDWIAETAPQAIVSGRDVRPPFGCR